MGESTAVWPSTQQERLTDTSTSRSSVGPHPQCVHRGSGLRMTGGSFCALCRLVPPSIRDSGGESPLVVNTRAGKSLTLRCETSAVPPPNITWYKNGRLVTESTNLRVLKERQMLEIQTTRVKLRSCTSPTLLHAEKCLKGLRTGSYFPIFIVTLFLGLLGVRHWTVCLQSSQHCRTSGQELPFKRLR